MIRDFTIDDVYLIGFDAMGTSQRKQAIVRVDGLGVYRVDIKAKALMFADLKQQVRDTLEALTDAE